MTRETVHNFIKGLTIYIVFAWKKGNNQVEIIGTAIDETDRENLIRLAIKKHCYDFIDYMER